MKLRNKWKIDKEITLAEYLPSLQVPKVSIFQTKEDIVLTISKQDVLRDNRELLLFYAHQLLEEGIYAVQHGWK